MFITFEGINGSGKSTQAKLLFEYLKKQGKDVILTKEPNQCNDFCTKIRELLVNTKDISKLTEMFLFFASRKEHLDKLIQPALEKGKIVICDRYVDSTFAYQCCDDVQKTELVKFLNQQIGGLMPDKTFLIDISVAESEYRLAPLIYESTIRGVGYKKYDELQTEHMQKILNVYHKLADENKDRIVSIDGTLSIQEISQKIINTLNF